MQNGNKFYMIIYRKMSRIGHNIVIFKSWVCAFNIGIKIKMVVDCTMMTSVDIFNN